MYDEKDLEKFLKIKKYLKINKWFSLLFIIYCIACPVMEWTPLDIPSSSMGLIGFFYAIQFLFYSTPKYGIEDACALVEKAINLDSDSLMLYNKLKNSKSVKNS